MTFHLTCVHIIFSSVSVAEWPLLWKKLLTRLTICSLCILNICNISYFPFWFEGWIWVLIAPVPGRCVLYILAVPKAHVELIVYQSIRRPFICQSVHTFKH